MGASLQGVVPDGPEGQAGRESGDALDVRDAVGQVTRGFGPGVAVEDLPEGHGVDGTLGSMAYHGAPVGVGQRFGQGIVIVPDAGRNGRGSVMVRLTCSCGTEYVARRSDLWNAGTQSCGCLRRETAAKMNQVAKPVGADHHNWTGDDASRNALHKRIPWRAESCAWGCVHTHYERAHVLGETGPPDEYAGMCKLCHKPV